MNDAEVRFHVYDVTMREGAPPRVTRLAELMNASESDVVAALRRLYAAHMLVLQPDSEQILMAGPFSAVPTPFRVTLDAFTCYANCIWDALGIAATLRADADVDTSCADCGTAARIGIRSNELIGEGFMHLALPPRVWWQDIVFT